MKIVRKWIPQGNTAADRASARLSETTLTSGETVIVLRALIHAEREIHNPGAARSSNIDLLDLIRQAKLLLQ